MNYNLSRLLTLFNLCMFSVLMLKVYSAEAPHQISQRLAATENNVNNIPALQQLTQSAVGPRAPGAESAEEKIKERNAEDPNIAVRSGLCAQEDMNSLRMPICLTKEIINKIDFLGLSKKITSVGGKPNENLKNLTIYIGAEAEFQVTPNAFAQAFDRLHIKGSDLTIDSISIKYPVIYIFPGLVDLMWVYSKALAMGLFQKNWGSKTYSDDFKVANKSFWQKRNMESFYDLKMLSSIVDLSRQISASYNELNENAVFKDFLPAYESLMKQQLNTLIDAQHIQDQQVLRFPATTWMREPEFKTLNTTEANGVLNFAKLIFIDTISAILAHEISHVSNIPWKMIRAEKNSKGEVIFKIDPKFQSTLFNLLDRQKVSRKEEIEADKTAYKILRDGFYRPRQGIGLVLSGLFFSQMEGDSAFSSWFKNSTHPSSVRRIDLAFAMSEHFGDTLDQTQDWGCEGLLPNCYEQYHFLAPFKAKSQKAKGQVPDDWSWENAIPDVIDKGFLKALL